MCQALKQIRMWHIHKCGAKVESKAKNGMYTVNTARYKRKDQTVSCQPC